MYLTAKACSKVKALNHHNMLIKMGSLYRERMLYIRNSKGDLTGPKYVYDGLPQGAIKIPVLFNLCTVDLFELLGNVNKIIQYAYDFVIYTTHKTQSILPDRPLKLQESFATRHG